MLAYVVGVAVHVSYRMSRRDQAAINDRGRRQLAADLGVEVAVVRSIVVVAPYLGLVGACVGILGAFTGIDVVAESGFAAVAPRVPLGFVTTAVGVMVAIAATCVNNCLARRIESLRRECSADKAPTGDYSRVAPQFPLRKRFSGLPAYALIAAPVFACLVAAYSPYVDPQLARGFAVDLAPLQRDVGERLLVLHVTDTGRIFLNMEQEEWRTLPGRLAEIYRLRADRTIYLMADDGVPYQKVMDAMDVVESAAMPDGERIRIRLVTPMGRCPVPTAVVRLVRGRAVPLRASGRSDTADAPGRAPRLATRERSRTWGTGQRFKQSTYRSAESGAPPKSGSSRRPEAVCLRFAGSGGSALPPGLKPNLA